MAPSDGNTEEIKESNISEKNKDFYFPEAFEPNLISNKDNVKSPSHYNHLDAFCQCGERYQPYKLTQELPFNKGSAIKYIVRSGHKDDERQDLEKAKQFIDFEIERIDGKYNNQAFSEKGMREG